MVCSFQLLLICVFFLKTCSLIICQTNVINKKPVLQRRYQTVIFAESDGLNEKPKGFGRPKIVASSKEIIADASTSIETDGAVQKIPEMKTPRQRMIEELDSKIKTLQEEEQLLASDPSVGAVPEIVANRMIGRIAAFFGIPVFGGLLIFVGAFFYSKKYDVVVPPSIIAYATQAPFLIGLLGITYAILSSSWDDEPGSLLGFNEFKINVERVKEGLDRSKNTALLKEDIEKESKRLGRK